MKTLFPRGSKCLIGVVHLGPLPGSPRWIKGTLQKTIAKAIADARAYARGGADALEIENFGDVPFSKSSVPPETVACMAVVGRAVRDSVDLPVGFNVLRNDPRAALALCAACRGLFVRINVLTGAMVTDQGIIEGNAFETLRQKQVLCPDVQILADVLVKHAVPLAPITAERAALDTLKRGLADGLILSGGGTGEPTSPEVVKRVRTVCPRALLFVGSGVCVGNVADYAQLADGFVVGTSLKRGGRIQSPVDWRRVLALKRAILNKSR